jgi:hypothetical protein
MGLEIRIGDKDFEVNLVPDRSRDHGVNSSACSSEWYQKIYISINDRKKDGLISDLWHEIIEMVNLVYDLNLNHTAISTLGSAVHQVIRDNTETIEEIRRKGE